MVITIHPVQPETYATPASLCERCASSLLTGVLSPPMPLATSTTSAKRAPVAARIGPNPLRRRCMSRVKANVMYVQALLRRDICRLTTGYLTRSPEMTLIASSIPMTTCCYVARATGPNHGHASTARTGRKSQRPHVRCATGHLQSVIAISPWTRYVAPIFNGKRMR